MKSFIQHGECPFKYDDVVFVFLCSNVSRLFVALMDGRVYEQDYYIDIPGIHWFVIADTYIDSSLDQNRIVTLRKDALFINIKEKLST